MTYSFLHYIKASSGILLILVVLAFVCSPFQFPYTIHSTAKVFPLQKWELHKQLDGSLMSSWHNFLTGQMKDYTSYQFDRGDVVNIQFNPSDIDENKVEKETLIASISSNKLRERLVLLQNKLRVEQALLAKEQAGSKRTLIQEAEETHRLAIQELALHKKRFERTKGLWAEGLIAKSAYEAHENSLKEGEIKVQLAQRKIATTTAGEKREQIQLIEARIQSFQQEIQFLKTQNNYFEIQTPIAGKLHFETGTEGDKLIVEDTSAHILIIPVRLKDKRFIQPNSIINLQVIGVDSSVQAQLVELGNKVEILNRETVVLAKAKVIGNALSISSGMPIRCQVHCGDVTPWEFLKRSVRVDLK